MSASTDPDARKAFIDGLRALARFLVTHPDMPVPVYSTSLAFSVGDDDDSERETVDAFAAVTGAAVEDTWAKSGHYSAERAFGPITYRAFAVSAARMSAYHAEQSYTGCVQPEQPAILDEFGEAA